MLFLRISLAAIFTFAASTKFADRHRTQRDFATLALPNKHILVTLAIATDLFTAICLLFLPLVGFATATTVLSVYTMILLRALRYGSNPKCACFGTLSSSKVGYTTIARNIILLLVAAVGLIAV